MKRKEVLKLFSYMITSAKNLMNEPQIYGPLRLVDSMSRWFHLLKENNLIDDKGLAEVINLIDEKKYMCMTDEEEFMSMLDDAVNGMVNTMISE
ncbi:MAG: hypothetical protein GX969_02885 [Firmicutes bacterium]|nr:hypothetical protein [Bacillota bacterium]